MVHLAPGLQDPPARITRESGASVYCSAWLWRISLGTCWSRPTTATSETSSTTLCLYPDGGYAVEGDLDSSVVRYTQEVAEFAERLADADERTRCAPLDEVERELERVREESTRQQGATA